LGNNAAGSTLKPTEIDQHRGMCHRKRSRGTQLANAWATLKARKLSARPPALATAHLLYHCLSLLIPLHPPEKLASTSPPPDGANNKSFECRTLLSHVAKHPNVNPAPWPG
jgi:hypothetical protein